MIRLFQKKICNLARNDYILNETIISLNEKFKYLEEKSKLLLLSNYNCKVCKGKGFYYDIYVSSSGKVTYRDKDCYVCIK